MEKFQKHGDFASFPLPFLLFHIWKSELSGTLEIKPGNDTFHIDFKRGNICIDTHSIEKKTFLSFITEKDIMAATKPTTYQKLEKKSDLSIIRALSEAEHMPASELWAQMNEFSKDQLLRLFEYPQAEYLFHSDSVHKEYEILFYIPTLDFILQGIRQMQNHDIVLTHIPPPEADIRLLNPNYLREIRLTPVEIYLYHVVENQKSLKKIYASSEISEKEVQKIIFSFLSIGIIGDPHNQGPNIHSSELSQVHLFKILDAFNTKSTYIFKYISKEIGPAAWSVMGKCIEEIRAHLSPFFQNVRLDADGKIEADSIQKPGSSSLREDARQTFLSDLDEILATEILAVKKTLGNSHETELIKNLEKVGQWN